MNRSAMGRAIGVAAGVLPACFWVLYTLWNTVLTSQPPSIGRLTLINALYLLMIPATIAAVLRWRLPRVPGFWPYAAYVTWVALGTAWHGWRPDFDPAKVLIINALLGFSAAQILAGEWAAELTFSLTAAVVTVGLSAWAVWHALETGFMYRSGVAVNANFVSTAMGPGLLLALGLHARAVSKSARAVFLAAVLLSFYATLLLGSRTTLLAVLAGSVAFFALARPSFRRSRALLAGAAATVLVAQLPVIPYTIWQSGVKVVERVEHPAATPVASDSTAPRAAAVAPSPSGGSTKHAPLPTIDAVAPLNAEAAESTAFARFGEARVTSFNLRSSLWQACLQYALSSPGRLLFGGGLGTAAYVAWGADPAFRNAHDVFLAVLGDHGVVGVVLFVCAFGALAIRLFSAKGALSAAWFGVVTFWGVSALAETVNDLHLFWVSLGVAAASAAGPRMLRPRAPEDGDRAT